MASGKSIPDNQWQSLALPGLAKALGVDEKRWSCAPICLGGGFGRRLNGDYAVPAALASKALGKPVKMVCTRADERCSIRSARRPCSACAWHSTRQGKVTAMQHDAAAGWPTQVMAPSFMPKGSTTNPMIPFRFPAPTLVYGGRPTRACHLQRLGQRAFRPGWLRSVGPGWTNWALESFMDEAAHKVEMDPSISAWACSMAGKNAGRRPTRSAVHCVRPPCSSASRKNSAGDKSLPEDTGIGRRHHLWPGTRHADLGRVRGACQVNGDTGRVKPEQADPRRRCRHHRASRWCPGAGAGRRAVGREHGPA